MLAEGTTVGQRGVVAEALGAPDLGLPSTSKSTSMPSSRVEQSPTTEKSLFGVEFQACFLGNGYA